MAMGRKARARPRDRARSFRNDISFSSQTVGDNAPLDTISRMDSSSRAAMAVAYADVLACQVEGAVSAAVTALRGFAESAGAQGRCSLMSGGWP